MLYLLSQLPDLGRRFSHRSAFVCGDQRLSYLDLLDSSERLAASLIQRGVGRGDRVGILLPKCLETAVAVYGILKAGGAYVPIDPASPPERIARVAEDCGMRHLITSPDSARRNLELLQLRGPFCAVFGIEPEEFPGIVSIPWRSLEDAPKNVGFPNLVDDDIAYIMYTSGSTGAPKGMIHTHRSGLAYARMAGALYEVDETARLGNFAPLHFDQSTFELFAGPLQGATTVMIPEAVARLPASLTILIAREHLTHWYSVPYVLIQMLLRGALNDRDLGTLRWVQYGGEPFPVQHLRELMKILPNTRFSNVYGPAEVNQCTYHHLSGPPESDDVSVPIGQMCPNAEGLVVDAHDQTVETGEAGELLVRSATMMCGYWARPDLNAVAFSRRPGPGGQERCYYRTGDRVRENPQGALEFLGRLDRQIKTRGYRIELEEIEAQLGSHQDVVEAAVFLVADASGADTLEAVVLASDGGAASGRDLRRYLAKKLPSYAIPSKVEVVRTLPRTGSGKIDRLRLQEQARSRSRANE